MLKQYPGGSGGLGINRLAQRSVQILFFNGQFLMEDRPARRRRVCRCRCDEQCPGGARSKHTRRLINVAINSLVQRIPVHRIRRHGAGLGPGLGIRNLKRVVQRLCERRVGVGYRVSHKMGIRLISG